MRVRADTGTTVDEAEDDVRDDVYDEAEDDVPDEVRGGVQDRAQGGAQDELAGMVVAITGASGTLGAGIARRCAAAGASLVLHHRDAWPDHLDVAAGAPQVRVRTDLTDPDGPQRLVDAAVEAFGRLDALINNAGVQPLATLAEVDDDAWRDVMAVNVDAVHRCTRAFARHRRELGGGGAVVHIASIEGRTPAAAHGHYATSKAAVRMHARAAAQEFGSQGLRVNTVSPGLIMRAGLEREWPDGVASYRAAAPLGRLGRAEEVGDACVFLVSPRAAFITGAELVVDGGMQTVPGW